MNGQTLHFGACGAVSNVWNPISLAKHLCMKQCENLSLGRVPPCILTGQGARSWAERMGLEIVDERKMISARAFRNYKHSKRKLKRYSLQNDISFSPLDTVGAICVDSGGMVASGASSGGVSLKHEGRVGQAASFGSGVWAVMSRDGKNPSVASCTSGCGEHLIRTQLAKNSAESLLDSSPTLGLDKCLKENFLNSPFLWDVSERLGGTLALRFDPDNGEGELLWGHTTKTMCIGYMSTENERPKVRPDTFYFVFFMSLPFSVYNVYIISVYSIISTYESGTRTKSCGFWDSIQSSHSTLPYNPLGSKD
ncbi:unnamed protein product [Diatraea saccharalis]|uniref:Threonine aspartase n=1 Tax=Diatraea saccharalis TaxID=40085 RepID=A0A9P0FZF2_9NEOP|nr:unnamed protein product [Diatraea saccharalis]